MVSSPWGYTKAACDRIRCHISALEGIRHPLADPVALERAANYISTHFSSLGYEVTEHLFPENGQLFRNIIASRFGHTQRDERIIVLAHYDTVAGSPGADDNASGVAVLLEVATLLAPLRYKRTLQFIGVSLEENAQEDTPGSGTRGSRALAAHAKGKGWDIKGVVVLESVAYAGNQIVQTAPPNLPIVVPSIGNFIAVVGNERSTPLVNDFTSIIKKQHSDLPFVSLTVPGNGELMPDTRRSDHAPFWDMGYQAIMLTDTTNFRNPHYHRSTDTLETLNLDFAVKVCDVTIGLVDALGGRLE